MIRRQNESNHQHMPKLVRGCRFRVFGWIALTGIFLGSPIAAQAIDTLTWRTNQNEVSADIQSARLVPVLERVARATGWNVFLEPGVSRSVSAKFTNQPPGTALRFLLGDLNFALVPET